MNRGNTNLVTAKAGKSKRNGRKVPSKMREMILDVMKSPNGTEDKFLLSTIAGVPVDTNGGTALYNVTTIPQGLADNQRVGDSILLDKFFIRGCLYNGLGSASSVRMLLFSYSGAPNGFSLAQLIYGSILGTANAPYSPYTHDYTSLFKVWVDQLVCLDTYNPTKGFEAVVQFSGKYSEVRYIAGANALAINTLYLLFIADQNTVGNRPTVTASFEIDYHDA